MTDDDVSGVEIVAPVHISQIDDDSSTVASTSTADAARVVTDTDVDLYGNMDDAKDDKDAEAKSAIPVLELTNDDSIIKTAPKVVMGDGMKNVPLIEEPSDDEAQARSSTSTNVPIVEEPTSSYNNNKNTMDDADNVQTADISSQCSSTGAKIEEQNDDEVGDKNAAVMTDDVIINESLPQQEFPTTTKQQSTDDNK
eukprot:UN02892